MAAAWGSKSGHVFNYGIVAGGGVWGGVGKPTCKHVVQASELHTSRGVQFRLSEKKGLSS